MPVPPGSPTPSPSGYGKPERRALGRDPAPAAGALCTASLAAGGQFEPATLLNITAHGAGLRCRRHFAPGLAVSLELANAARGSYLRVACQVVHATGLSGGNFALGVRFDRPLSFVE